MQEIPLRLLLIDKNAADARTLSEIAATVPPPGLTMLSALSLAQAREYLASEGIDVVLLTLAARQGPRLPEVLDEAGDAGNLALRKLPLIVLVAPGEDELGRAALAQGAQDYLVKGRIGAALLVRAARYAIERQHLVAEQHRLTSELQEARVALAAGSLLDPLTGAYTRAAFVSFGEHMVNAANRVGMSLQILVATLDNAVAIRTEFGRATADLAVQDMAGLLQRTFRQTDVVARLGPARCGLLAVAAAPSSGALLAARLQIALKAHAAQGHRPYTLSASVTTTAYTPAAPCSFDELLARTEEAPV